MGKIFDNYGVNRMNLIYLKDCYKTSDLSPAAQEWFLNLRSNLIKALNNGLCYFNANSKGKVLSFIEKIDGVEQLRRFISEMILKDEVEVDYLHKPDQKTCFNKALEAWQPLCPIVYIFKNYHDGKTVYLKVRVASNDKLGIDIHEANYMLHEIKI